MYVFVSHRLRLVLSSDYMVMCRLHFCQILPVFKKVHIMSKLILAGLFEWHMNPTPRKKTKNPSWSRKTGWIKTGWSTDLKTM